MAQKHVGCDEMLQVASFDLSDQPKARQQKENTAEPLIKIGVLTTTTSNELLTIRETRDCVTAAPLHLRSTCYSRALCAPMYDIFSSPRLQHVDRQQQLVLDLSKL